MTSNANPTTERTTHIYTIVFEGWRQLTKSRDAIICEYYASLAKSKGITLEDSLNASEARESFLDTEAMALESKLVLASRLCSAWMVLWTSILPFIAAGCWVAYQLVLAPNQNVIFAVFTCAIAIALLFVGAFIGLAIQSLFVRPYVAVVNWAIGLPSTAI